MKKFIGRKEELAKLNEIYENESFKFGIVYGRRRIGKSTLLKKFIENKKGIYLVATERTAELNLEEFAKVIGNGLGLSNLYFKSFGDMFEFLFNNIKEKFVLIIDEFTYLIDSSPSIMSELQNCIDKYRDVSQLKFIISGSHVGMIENMLSYKKPLYARKDFDIKLTEYDYYESSMFYPNFSNEDKVRAYAVFSGVPHYLTLIDDKKSLKDNIIDLFLKSGANLSNEVDFLLQIEFRSVSNYSSVIQAISKGKTRLNEISQASYIDNTAKTSTYLKPLIDMEIVEKEFSFKEEKNTKKTIYKIKNNLVNFIYTFIENNKTQKEYLNAEDFYNLFIEPKLDEYVSFIFENVCHQFLIRKNKLSITTDKIIRIGRYWLNDIKSKTQIEIDICIETISNKIVIFECKWTNSQIDNKILDALMKKAESINEFKVDNIGAFSKSGFNNNLKNSGNYLYNLENLFDF